MAYRRLRLAVMNKGLLLARAAGFSFFQAGRRWGASDCPRSVTGAI